MERRKAITAAAAASLTMLAGAAGIALNSGIVGANSDGNVGRISPLNTSVQPTTVYVDDLVTATTAAPLVLPTTSAPVAISSASGYLGDSDDDHEDDDRFADEEDDRGEEEDEYQGADDDD